MFCNGYPDCFQSDADWDCGQSAPPSGSFTAVSAGVVHTCGINQENWVQCWGDDAFGEAEPPHVPFLRVAAGGRHSCGIRTDRTLTCWGDDSLGQTQAPAGEYVDIACGWNHCCAIATGGAVHCWGDHNAFKTLPSEAFAQISASGYWNCGTTRAGLVRCWGSSQGPSNGPPSGSFHATAADPDGGGCGLRQDGQVECWKAIMIARPDGVELSGRYVSVASGGLDNCAISEAGDVQCQYFELAGAAR